ncbi:regulatory protein RecX [Trichlorobacter sp.]|uniref:regulatory protein RecX n=1 Tax=Trichlorobacter sp. TaxID=2911007 RepID=UPI0039C8EB4D
MTGSSQPGDCYLAALRLLTGQDYTCAALRRKLQMKRFSAEVAHQAVERLISEGYLDDQRYAERFVAAARQSGRYVGYRLRQELRRRGVAPELIDQVLRNVPDDGDELAQARELIERRYAAFNPQEADDRQRRRIAGFLQRRGYRGDVVRQLLER